MSLVSLNFFLLFAFCVKLIINSMILLELFYFASIEVSWNVTASQGAIRKNLLIMIIKIENSYNIQIYSIEEFKIKVHLSH